MDYRGAALQRLPAQLSPVMQFGKPLQLRFPMKRLMVNLWCETFRA